MSQIHCQKLVDGWEKFVKNEGLKVRQCYPTAQRRDLTDEGVKAERKIKCRGIIITRFGSAMAQWSKSTTISTFLEVFVH